MSALTTLALSGFCGCGCGQKTEIAQYSKAARGWVKGKPKGFLFGHSRRPRGAANHSWKGGRSHDARGYSLVLAPDHPRANSKGYVREHVQIAEAALGRPLRKGEAVHHINGEKTDNRRENLMICTQAYHMMLHRRQLALEACGNPDWRACAYCGVHEPTDALVPRDAGHGAPKKYVHRVCLNAANRAGKVRRKAANFGHPRDYSVVPLKREDAGR